MLKAVVDQDVSVPSISGSVVVKVNVLEQLEDKIRSVE